MISAEKRSDSGQKAASPALECRSVTVEFFHKFNRKRIIEDISFLVRSGEFFTIVGPSGTGKTTLLRAMGGLTPTASGSVLVHGKELDAPPKMWSSYSRIIPTHYCSGAPSQRTLRLE
jgi:ABC-type Fe3+/spermidine/putrescine transport system ATPase subunit